MNTSGSFFFDRSSSEIDMGAALPFAELPSPWTFVGSSHGLSSPPFVSYLFVFFGFSPCFVNPLPSWRSFLSAPPSSFCFSRILSFKFDSHLVPLLSERSPSPNVKYLPPFAQVVSSLLRLADSTPKGFDYFPHFGVKKPNPSPVDAPPLDHTLLP